MTEGRIASEGLSFIYEVNVTQDNQLAEELQMKEKCCFLLPLMKRVSYFCSDMMIILIFLYYG